MSIISWKKIGVKVFKFITNKENSLSGNFKTRSISLTVYFFWKYFSSGLNNFIDEEKNLKDELITFKTE